ncbi:MAG: DNA-3-methyladenine glycosylase 2 family protein [Spirochaetaceae bacterium]|nr:MAG: DNA-3-methyladenine glycosylase 2 family protein [Spirochaetaceae bacterium]
MRQISWWQQACKDLSSRDLVIAGLVRRHRGDRLRGSGHAFRTLVNAIVGQQISVAAADSIWARLTHAFPGAAPEALAAADTGALRAVGLSNQKAACVRNAALAFCAGTIDPAAWDRMSDDEIRADLTALRGVGPWTADMMLIFHLHRPDVLPLGDIGLVNAAARLYGWSLDDDRQRRQRLRDHAERWRPWRTVATWFIWRDLDAEPVVY